jgi:argininosuccinate lyase
MQEDKVHIFAASDTVEACLDVGCAIVSHTKFNKKKISAKLDEGFLDATSLADYLVGKGVAFREAHGIVGSMVAFCEEQSKKLAELSLFEMQRYSVSIEQDVYENLGAASVANKYVTEGSAGPKQAKEQVAYWNKQLGQR